jgi:hypothetical protein
MRRPADELDLMADGAPVPDEPDFEPRPLKTARIAQERWGDLDIHFECLFCDYVGEHTATLPQHEYGALVELMRGGIGNKQERVGLCEMLAQKYASLRATVNARLRPGERPLPLMLPAHFYVHLESHTNDFELKQSNILNALQETRLELCKGLIEYNPRTGAVRGNKNQIDCLTKVIATEMMVHGKDPSKMSFYSGGARVNPTAAKQGPASFAGKNIVDLWKRRR